MRGAVATLRPPRLIVCYLSSVIVACETPRGQPGQTLLQQLTQFPRQRLGHLRPAMELRGCILQQSDAPLARAIDRHHRLHRIDRRIDIRLPRRYHSDDGTEQSNIGREQADVADFADVGRGDVVGEYLAEALASRRFQLSNNWR